jgi:hypothetical protein
MLVMQGYFENNTFHPDTKEIKIPQKKRAVVTFIDEKEENSAEKIRLQLEAIKEFSAGIQADPQKLTSKYDEAISEGLHFKEYDWK